MAVPVWLWIVFSLGAAASQTARNAMQRDLIVTLGTAGSTFVRFLFGLPFALLFLGLVIIFTGPPPALTSATLIWTTIGALAQIAATGLMLAAMRTRSFMLVIAYTKAEPLLVALFGLIVLGDSVTPMLASAIVLATTGVTIMSLPKPWPAKLWPKSPEPQKTPPVRPNEPPVARANWAPVALGTGSAALFALSATGYRGGILSLHCADFILGATTTLALALTIQSAVILAGLVLFNRAGIVAILAVWRPSLLAGLTGAVASQLWFSAFAIETAAHVRTMALTEVIFAQIVSRKIFHQQTSLHEYAGMALMLTGVLLLLWA